MSDPAASPAPVRVGIVGAGSWAALAHIPAVLAHPNASLAGVADRDPERLAMTADHHGIRERYADHRELIASGELDALVVATPHATHYEVARDALDAGLHVLVEKPMTVRAADAKDLDARARAAGLHLVVGYTNQFAPGAIAARSLVQRGELGEITLVSGLFTSGLEDILTGFPSEDSSYAQASPIGGPGAATYADPARSGGGQGQSQATHALGMLAWITGLRARRVAALMSNRGAAVDLIDAHRLRARERRDRDARGDRRPRCAPARAAGAALLRNARNAAARLHHGGSHAVPAGWRPTARARAHGARGGRGGVLRPARLPGRADPRHGRERCAGECRNRRGRIARGGLSIGGRRGRGGHRPGLTSAEDSRVGPVAALDI